MFQVFMLLFRVREGSTFVVVLMITGFTPNRSLKQPYTTDNIKDQQGTLQ